MRHYARVVTVAVAFLLVLPIAAWPDPPELFTDPDLVGTLDLSIPGGTLTGHGDVLHAEGIGAARWELDASLELVPAAPLCRRVFGTTQWTHRSGSHLLFSLFGTVCYDPNSRLFYEDGTVFQLKLIEATGRFEGWTGGGVWALTGAVDESGTVVALTDRTRAEVTLTRR